MFHMNDTNNEIEIVMYFIIANRITSEKDAKTEKEWRTTLQKLIDEQQEQVTHLQQQLERMRLASSESLRVQNENQILKKKCFEYELSLEEVGKQLQE